MTVHLFPTPLVSTSTVGSGNVVLISYMGIGLWGLVVLLDQLCLDQDPAASMTYSHETSTTTLNRLEAPASAMNSEVTNLGIGLER
jgi:hypothetical protein